MAKPVASPVRRGEQDGVPTEGVPAVAQALAELAEVAARTEDLLRESLDGATAFGLVAAAGDPLIT
ncbi:hypothetical protein [Crossiella sp. CA198]|uniref:hypothetical protein n=1 Tax=Crossiella sp. CA198 TaxID=3455607 RepID=UPI003F8D6040